MEINIIRRLDMDRTLDTTKGWIWTGHWTLQKVGYGQDTGQQRRSLPVCRMDIRDVEAVLFLWKRKRENCTASAST